MSTRSNIGYKDKDSGEIHFVYCHFDGYLEGVGSDLQKEFVSYDRVVELVSQGDMSSIGEPYTLRGESFDSVKPRIVTDMDKTIQEEYSYIFDNNEWVYATTSGGWKTF
jgi:hypothetical protein